MLDNSSCGRVEESWLELVFRVQLVLSPLSCLIGVFGNVSLLVLIPRVHLWSANVRLLLVNINCAALLTNLYGLVRFALHDRFFLLSFAAAPAPVFTVTFCRCLETFFGLAATPLAYALPAIAVERWLINKEVLKPVDDKVSVFVTGTVGVSWAMGLATVGGLLLGEETGQICFCQYAGVVPRELYLVLATLLVIQELVVNGLVYHVLRLHRLQLANFHLQTASHSLSKRFELKGTVQITEMLMPSVALHTAAWLILVFLSFKLIIPEEFRVNFRQFSPPVASLGFFVHFLVLFHATLHPFVVFFKSKSLKKKLKNAMGKESPTATWVEPIPEGFESDHHANILNKIWTDFSHRSQKRNTENTPV